MSSVVSLLLVKLLFHIERIDVGLGNLIRVIFSMILHLANFIVFYFTLLVVFMMIGRFAFYEA